MNYLSSLNYGNKILKSNNIISYKIDSELLLARALNKSREEILTNLNFTLDQKEFCTFKRLLIRRKQKEPLAYIFNQKDFWKYNFLVNKDVLIPRPETEIIVEEVLKLTNYNSSKLFLDVGTGSGCLILSILKERPHLLGTAIDISKKALKIAINNAKMHHLENKIKFINIDIDKFNNNKYDFIVSNPPYIKKIDLMRLDKDVRCYEPLLALNGGLDGLRNIEKLITKSKRLLKNNGKLIFEMGNNQVTDVVKMLNKNKFYVNEVCEDIQSIPRVVISTKLF
mgnify:CR=1 FL=1